MEIGRLSALLTLDPDPKPAAPSAASQGPSFADIFSNALKQVEQDQKAAEEATVKLVTGEVQDFTEVLIASERANLTLSLALQVRTKVLEAYQEIMRTQL